ncbi:MAG TPA: hypothetical protein VFP17_11685 [Solirubrobacterales bacterium]|nr:hypothetical protein [Solirubrobacterales bacterium]
MGQKLEDIGGFFKKHAPHGPTVVVSVALALALVIGYVVVDHRGGEDSVTNPLPPSEFLYLDGPRVLNLLSELRGGEQGEIHRLTKEINSLSAKVGTGSVEGGASSQRETATEVTITQNEASELGILLTELKNNTNRGVAYHYLDLNKPMDLTDLKEGMLVKFKTRNLLSPGYIRPYVVMRQSATLSALFPPGSGSHVLIERSNAESFVNQVGPNPRITFAITPNTEKSRHLKVLLPMSYDGLTQERSLLEKSRDEYTGGQLFVMGEVIRVFANPSTVHCQEEDRCAFESPEYTDWGTREVWRTALERAPDYLINHVSHSCEKPRDELELETYFEYNAHAGRGPVPPVTGRLCFLRKLARQTELFSPGAVIVPIAIYKG